MPPPPPRGLDDYRVAQLLGLRQDVARVARGGRHTRYNGDPRGGHGPAGAELVAGQAEGIAARADEDEVRLGAGVGEGRVLGQEAVAGVYRFAPCLLRRLDYFLDIQIGLERRRGADAVRLVRPGDVEGGAVRLGVDGHGADAQLAAGAYHAAGYLAAVRDEDFGESSHYVGQ